MYHQRQLFTVGIAIAALCSLLFMFGCSNTTETSATSGTEPTAVLGAAGSTFIAPLMASGLALINRPHPKVAINYRPIGSGGGIEEMKQGYLSFGASDAPLSDDQVKEMSLCYPDSGQCRSCLHCL